MCKNVITIIINYGGYKYSQDGTMQSNVEIKIV